MRTRGCVTSLVFSGTIAAAFIVAPPQASGQTTDASPSQAFDSVRQKSDIATSSIEVMKSGSKSVAPVLVKVKVSGEGMQHAHEFLVYPGARVNFSRGITQANYAGCNGETSNRQGVIEAGLSLTFLLSSKPQGRASELFFNLSTSRFPSIRSVAACEHCTLEFPMVEGLSISDSIGVGQTYEFEGEIAKKPIKI